MFHHHPSTGEPPTPPLLSTSAPESRLTSGQDTAVNQRSTMTNLSTTSDSSHHFYYPASSSVVDQQQMTERGRSNTIPSHDSGLEMSPNLNRDSEEFFLEQEVFDDARDCDFCHDCDDEFCLCLRSDSSRTTIRSPSNASCDIYSEQSVSHRPSSLPIAIASRRPSTTLPSTSFSWRHRQRRSSHSLPVSSSPHLPVFEAFLSRSHPRMWPNAIHMNTEEGQRTIANTPCSRRIHSSYSSSIESFFNDVSMEPLDEIIDDAFQDDVYEMAEEELAFYPADFRRRLNSEATAQPLPDLILQSSPRRNRSASVNLPPDHAVLRDIGRSLRRISDDFQSRQQQANHRPPEPVDNNRPAFPGFAIFRKV